MLGKSVNGFAHGRDTGGRHVESARNLIFHIRITVVAMVEKRTATKPVATTVDSTPPKRWNKCSGMIAV